MRTVRLVRRMAVALLVLASLAPLPGHEPRAGALSNTARVTIAYTGSYDYLYSMASDPSGNVYAVDDTVGDVVKLVNGKGNALVLANDPGLPEGVTYYQGTLYVVNDDGSIDTLAPGGGPLTTLVGAPSITGGGASGQQVVFDGAGDLFVANSVNDAIGEVVAGTSREITSGISVPSGCGPWGLSIRKSTLFITCYDSDALLSAALPVPSGGEATTPVVTPTLGEPGEMAQDAAGNIYFANYSLNDIVKVPANGSAPSLLATSGTALSSPWGMTWTRGSLYTILSTSPNSIARILLPVPPVKRTITCVKGRSVKKVTRFSPRCPKGYKQR